MKPKKIRVRTFRINERICSAKPIEVLFFECAPGALNSHYVNELLKINKKIHKPVIGVHNATVFLVNNCKVKRYTPNDYLYDPIEP